MSYLWYWPSGGWDFDAWKKRQSWREILSAQSRRRAPLRLVERGTTLREWERRAEMWRSISDDLLGRVRDKPPRRLRFEWLGDALHTSGRRGIEMRRLRYRLTDDEWGYAWWLRPAIRSGARRPAIIALHQTHPHGKNEPVGLESAPGAPSEGGWAAEVVRRGFTVLAPDAIGFGERQAQHPHALYRSAGDFFRAHPDGSVMAKMAFDTARAVDLIERMPGVDASRIGCVGHSHGAYGTLFAMLADRRIKFGVMSCGLNLLRRDPTPQRWWRATALIPRLGFYEGDISETPMDFHHWLALLAPRPVMVIAATRDVHYPNTSHLSHSLETVRDVYRLYGSPADLHVDLMDGPHEFSAPARRRAWRFVTDVLDRTGS